MTLKLDIIFLIFISIIIILDFKSNFTKYYFCGFVYWEQPLYYFTKRYYHDFLRAVFRKLNSSKKATVIPN